MIPTVVEKRFPSAEEFNKSIDLQEATESRTSVKELGRDLAEKGYEP